jgi:hypothetical protein
MTTLTLAPLTYASETASSAYDLLTGHGSGHDPALKALVSAERFGTARVGQCLVARVGYSDLALRTVFDASTATYRVTIDR